MIIEVPLNIYEQTNIYDGFRYNDKMYLVTSKFSHIKKQKTYIKIEDPNEYLEKWRSFK